MNDLCPVGEGLLANLHLAEVSAWKATNSLTHRESLLAAEKALLTHTQSCETCAPAIHHRFLP